MDNGQEVSGQTDPLAHTTRKIRFEPPSAIPLHFFLLMSGENLF